MEGAGDRRVEYWENRAKPFFQKTWPKSQDLRTPDMSANFARLIVGCGDAFPDALKTLRGWLQPSEHADFSIHKLNESGLCERFPDEALTFLGLIFTTQPLWYGVETRTCLKKIVAAKPPLAADQRYIGLDTALAGC